MARIRTQLSADNHLIYKIIAFEGRLHSGLFSRCKIAILNEKQISKSLSHINNSN